MKQPVPVGIRPWLWRFFLLIAAATLILTIMSLVLWQFRTPLLSRAKPHIERYLSTEFDAQVAIERLELETGQLRVLDISIKHDDVYRLFVPHLIFDFSLKMLWRGQLDSLRVMQPELYLNLVGKPPDEGTRTPATTFQKPPVQIKLIQIIDGRFDLAAAERLFPLRSITLDMHGLVGDFHLSLELQAETPLVLTAVGSLSWETIPELQIRQLTIDDNPLLAAQMTLRPAATGLVAGGEIVFAQIDRLQLDPWLTFAGLQQRLPPEFDFAAVDLRLAMEMNAGELQGRLDAASLRLNHYQSSVFLTEITLQAAGEINDWRVEGRANLAEDIPLSFRLDGVDGRINAQAQGRIPKLAGLPALLGDEGQLPVDGGLEWVVRAELQNAFLELNADFYGFQPDRSSGIVPVNLAQMSGTLKVLGPIDELFCELLIDLAGARLLTLAGGLEALDGRVHRTPLSVLADHTAPSAWPQGVEKSGWIAGTFHLNLTDNKLQGQFDLSGDDWLVAGFAFGATRVSSRFRLHDGHLELSGFSTNTSGSGQGAIIPAAILNGSANWSSEALELSIATLELDNLEYLSADNMNAVAGGILRLSGTLNWYHQLQRLRTDLHGSVTVKEVLVHAFYGDLSQLPAIFSLGVDWKIDAGTLEIDNTEIEIPGIGSLHGQGGWYSDQGRLRGELQLSDLEQGFNRSLRPLLVPLYSWIQNLELSGALAIENEGTFTASGWSMKGTIRPLSFSLKWPDADMQLTSVEGEIPFVIASPGASEATVLTGHLAYSQLLAGPLSGNRERLNLTATTNRFILIDPWKLDLAGGVLLIENLNVGYESQGLLISGRSSITDMDLHRLTQAFDQTPMQGSLAADFGEFEYLGGVLQSEGEARIDVFDGTILIRNLKSRDMFSSYRSFEGDIDLQGIDLAQLTQTFEFGEINGIIDGTIRELRLFGKIPSSFVAEVATRNQGQRNISVKALNNLTVISQGGLSAALSRGVYRFIDFYRYRKIGIFCALRNDVFVLKGTARSDSELHLVDGGLLPPRIDVLAPGTGVSFREMLRRLERIDRTGNR